MPDIDDVRAAAARIAPFVHHTPVLTSTSLDEWLGVHAFLKAEHLQRTGAFKYRGATNAVQSLTATQAARGVAAHSSGNHAAALALAARTRGIPGYVVMPDTVPAVKRDAVVAFGATITPCENTPESRAETLAEVVERTGAVEIHPFDNDQVIAGAGTAALELMEQVPGLDIVIAPVGGGGLLSGTSIAVHGVSPETRVLGGEPLRADDAARSLATGTLQPPLPPTTIADGLLTGLSERTFTILREHVEQVVTVTEEDIVAAMLMIWERAKQVIEPSAAVAVAATRAAHLGGARVGIILSGGNVSFPVAGRRA
ncbi:MAG: pyridoxal-phosphate dependent enzyme [Actinomycetota bacterium]|nr:pyridoxal-phosphate dependent enzyme [Actinomycetota bacterium]